MTPTTDQLARLPNVLGVARCNDQTGSTELAGSEGEALANVLTCFSQLASLVGASFGLDELEEAHMTGKAVSVLCMPDAGGTLGLVLHSRAKPAEVANYIRNNQSPA